MTHYWPDRPSPEGFSIENLAKSCRDKLASISNPRNHYNQSNVREMTRKISPAFSSIQLPSGHWANRVFEEYQNP